VWMTAAILSHIFVLGYDRVFVDALMMMALAIIYLLLTRRQSHWGEPGFAERSDVRAARGGWGLDLSPRAQQS
jgi:chromate transport protein ChrA